MEKVIIIVPVHKLFHQLTQNELHSLKQLNSVLHDYIVCIVAPQHFSLNGYERFFSPQRLLIERFKGECFKNIRSYNRLCLSNEFYERFLNYKYMLVYQPDAYI